MVVPIARRSMVISQLHTPEILVVWAFRQRLDGGAECYRLACGFRRAFGLAAAELALATFAKVFDVIQDHSRREFSLMPPGCGEVSADELLLLQIVAAAQAGAIDQASRIAQALVTLPWAEPLADRARLFAGHLDRRGLNLSRHRFACRFEARRALH